MALVEIVYVSSSPIFDHRNRREHSARSNISKAIALRDLISRCEIVRVARRSGAVLARL